MDIGPSGCQQLGPKWDLDAVYTPDAPEIPAPTPEPNGRTVVQIIKSSAPAFAVDGNNGAANGQNVFLWASDPGNLNQQWVEINRGDGFFSYRKQGTKHCLAGGTGGFNGQNIFLWRCGANNQNQHWQKVATGSDLVQLRKRSAPGFALDGGNGGSRGRT